MFEYFQARRLKENQIALRTAYLEKENGALQQALDKSAAENERLKEENKRLKEALDTYENGLLSLNWSSYIAGVGRGDDLLRRQHLTIK